MGTNKAGRPFQWLIFLGEQVKSDKCNGYYIQLIKERNISIFMMYLQYFLYMYNLHYFYVTNILTVQGNLVLIIVIHFHCFIWRGEGGDGEVRLCVYVKRNATHTYIILDSNIVLLITFLKLISWWQSSDFFSIFSPFKAITDNRGDWRLSDVSRTFVKSQFNSF